MINNKFVDLILALHLEESPSKRYNIVLKFFAEHDDIVINREERLFLLKEMEQKVMEKSNQGKQAVTLRKKYSANANKKNFSSPRFFNNNIKGARNCAGCGDSIDSTNCFAWRRNGQYQYWHALPVCWPKEEYALFETADNWIKFKNGVK